MKKRSYRNKRINLKPKVKPSDLPSIPEAEEGYSGSQQGAGSAGFIVGRLENYLGRLVCGAGLGLCQNLAVVSSEKREK